MREIIKSDTKKADNGNRTRLSSLGSWRSTDELYPLVYSIKNYLTKVCTEHYISIAVNLQKEKHKNTKAIANHSKEVADRIQKCCGYL